MTVVWQPAPDQTRQDIEDRRAVRAAVRDFDSDVTRHLDWARRFWSKVHIGGMDECWEWQASLYVNGYGQFMRFGRPLRNGIAHRISYELAYGRAIPKGLELDHLCRNRRCVNPTHLEAVTRKENLLRGHGFSAVNARKTHCIHGHEFTHENTYRAPCLPGRRYCLTCMKNRDAEKITKRRIKKDQERWPVLEPEAVGKLF